MNIQKVPVAVCLAGLTALLVAGCAATPVASRVFTIEQFGAVGDGVHDDASALQKALHAMRTAGGRTELVFSAGKTYRLGKQTESDAQFDLSGMNETVVDGQGATLILHPVNGVARMVNCRNVTFKNFVIEHDPLPFMQGVITSVVPSEGYFLWRVQDGYPLPPSEEWMRQNGNFFDNPAASLPDQTGWNDRSGTRGPWRWGSVIDAKQRTLKKGLVDHLFIENVIPAEADAPQLFKVVVAPSYRKYLTDLDAGDRFILPRFRRTKEEYFALKNNGWMYEQNVQIRNSSDIMVENLTFYSARPGMVFGVRNNSGRIAIRGCTVTWKPGTDRLVASWRDGVHCKNNRIGPVIENCRFEGLFDDSINLSADAFMAEKNLTPNRFIMTGPGFAVGDRVGVFYPQSGEWETGVSVVSVDGREVEFDRLPKEPVPGTMTPRKDIGSTQFYNLSRANDGFIVRNCFFGVQRRHAVLCRCEHGIIENNVVDGVCGTALELCNESGNFYEGPFPRHLRISANRISGTARTPVIMKTANAPEFPSVEPVTGEILFEDNRIVSDLNPLVELSGVENVVFKGNCFFRADGTPVLTTDAIHVDSASQQLQFE